MKRWLCLCLCLLLTGCSHTYLERQLYPICLSVDTGEGLYEVALQAPRSSENAAYDVLSGKGETIPDALRVLAASTPYPLSFSQIRLCLISYETASSAPLRPVLSELFELPGMRPNAQVIITLGKAQEALRAQKPDFGQRLSTHLTVLFERLRREKSLPQSTLSYCVREMGDGRSDLLIALGAVNPSLAEPAFALGEPWSDQLLPANESAGMLSRTGPNPVEIAGSAALSEGRVTGALTGRETQLAVRLLEGAKRKTALEGGQVRLQVTVEQGSGLDGREQEIRSLIEKLQSLRSDPLLFGCEASRAFLTEEDWRRFAFRDRYPSASVVIKTE